MSINRVQAIALKLLLDGPRKQSELVSEIWKSEQEYRRGTGKTPKSGKTIEKLLVSLCKQSLLDRGNQTFNSSLAGTDGIHIDYVYEISPRQRQRVEKLVSRDTF
ncbi:MAG TPA: hypothetical protein V6D07_18920 [Trichocoleus sp.]